VVAESDEAQSSSTVLLPPVSEAAETIERLPSKALSSMAVRVFGIGVPLTLSSQATSGSEFVLPNSASPQIR
jgi:hypothetical protein